MRRPVGSFAPCILGRSIMRVPASSPTIAAAVALLVACGPRARSAPEAREREAESAPSCPTEPLRETVAPDVRPEHRTAAYWIGRLPEGAADAPLLDDAALQAVASRATSVDGAWRDPLDPAVADPDHVQAKLAERMAWMRSMVSTGKYVEAVAGTWAEAEGVVGQLRPEGSIRLVRVETPLRCAPLDAALLKPPGDPDFDRNACASLHPGEVVRVLGQQEGGDWRHVHAGHTTGWVHAEALSAPLDEASLEAVRGGERLWVHRDGARTDGGVPLRTGVSLPVVARTDASVTVRVPAAEGWAEDTVAPSSAVVVGPAPALTRRSLFEAALAHLDDPYGWGGREGHRDCSRYARDLLAGYGLELGRHSAVQARLGPELVDVDALDDEAKREAIREAAARGVVLLYMKGHIMLYLGSSDGRDYAVSSISEYLTPCPGGPDTVHRLDRVAVTTLELGRDTERRAFIERITALVVFRPLGAPA